MYVGNRSLHSHSCPSTLPPPVITTIRRKSKCWKANCVPIPDSRTARPSTSDLRCGCFGQVIFVSVEMLRNHPLASVCDFLSQTYCRKLDLGSKKRELQKSLRSTEEVVMKEDLKCMKRVLRRCGMCFFFCVCVCVCLFDSYFMRLRILFFL